MSIEKNESKDGWSKLASVNLISPFRNTAFSKIKPKGQNERGNDPLQGKMVSF